MEMKEKGIGRFTRWGIFANVGVMFIAALGVVLLVNLIARLPGFWTRWDLTTQERNTLAPQTVKILESLKDEVEILTFLRADPGTPIAPIVEELDTHLWRRLKQYNYASSGKVKHGKYRVDGDYAAAKSKLQELEIKDDANLIVVRSGEGKLARKKVLRLFPDIARIVARRNPMGKEEAPRIDSLRDEESLNQAILSVTEEKRPTVGFLVQHGEGSIRELEKPEGLGQFAQNLQKFGYEPGEVDLSQRPDALRGIQVLVISGTRSSLSSAEWTALREFVEGGGRLLLALYPTLDPARETDFAKLLSDWGIGIQAGVVRQSVGGHYGIPECALLGVLDRLAPLHPITKDLRDLGIRIWFYESRALALTGKAQEGMTLVPLASSEDDSWEDLAGGKNFIPDRGLETQGSRTVAIAVEKDSTEFKARMRAVVIGTPAPLSNYYFSSTQDFLMNSVSWLSARENLISIAPKPPDRRTMVWSEGRRDFFFWGSLIVFPSASLLAGFAVWLRRRKAK